jgi:hypothetical protein
MLLQVLVAHHQNMALGKGAVECDACFNVDRLGEVELNDFGARVIRQGRDGEGRHQLLLPTKSPPRSPAAARARRSGGIRVAELKPIRGGRAGADLESASGHRSGTSAEQGPPSMQKKPDDNVAQYKDRTDCAEDDVSDQIQLPFFWNGVGLVPNLSQFAQKLGVPLIVNSQLAAPIRSSRARWNR